MRKNIIILGGGFAGLRVARELANMPEVYEHYKIILVDRNAHHLYTPLLYEVASAFLQEMTPKEDFCMRQGVCTPFTFLQETTLRNRVRFVQGDVTAIDTKKQEITLAGEKFSYAYCVVALGSVTEDFGIPGIRDHGHIFKGMDDALRIHERITELLIHKRIGKEKRVTIVIGGGGPTGVELAAEISLFCRHACEKYNLSLEDFQITLIEATNRLLGTLSVTMSRWARERLSQFGVELHMDTCVKKVMKGSVVLAPRPLREGENPNTLLCDFRGEEETLEADIFIWSGGIRAPEVLKTSALLLDAKGRVDVHDTLLAKGTTNVFAIGDSAALLDPRTNRLVPALGQSAIAEAHVAAENIRQLIRGQHMTPYTFPIFAHVIPIGGKYAFAEFRALHLRGFLFWVLRQVINLKYFLTILSVWHALKTWFVGWRAYTKND